MTDANSWREPLPRWMARRRKGLRPHSKFNEDIAGVWELHPVVERSTLRRSVVNFQEPHSDGITVAKPKRQGLWTKIHRFQRREGEGRFIILACHACP